MIEPAAVGVPVLPLAMLRSRRGFLTRSEWGLGRFDVST
jgi:hypothetical protein